MPNSNKGNVHVTKNNDMGNWMTTTIGQAAGEVVLFETQEKAITRGKKIAKANKSELVIHGANGKIRAKHSYGNDPRPPSGSRG